MHSDGRARGAICVEVFGPDFVVATEVVHVDEIAGDLDAVSERCAFCCEDVANVFDDGAGLRFDIEACRSHRIDFDARERIVFAARAGAADEQEVASALDVREFSARCGFIGERRGMGHRDWRMEME